MPKKNTAGMKVDEHRRGLHEVEDRAQHDTGRDADRAAQIPSGIPMAVAMMAATSTTARVSIVSCHRSSEATSKERDQG